MSSALVGAAPVRVRHEGVAAPGLGAVRLVAGDRARAVLRVRLPALTLRRGIVRRFPWSRRRRSVDNVWSCCNFQTLSESMIYRNLRRISLTQWILISMVVGTSVHSEHVRAGVRRRR